MSFEINNLNLSYEDGNIVRTIFDNAAISFEQGKTYAVMGRSGSGKSSFISVISGIQKANSIEIKYDGRDIPIDRMVDFRKGYVGIVFQDYNLIDYLSPVQNINIATSIQSKEKLETEFINYLLDLVGISQISAKKSVSKLSGGEKQRVAVARALSINPKIILADEPTGNLDVENEKIIIELFKKVAVESNNIVIIVTHSPEVASMCDEVYTIKDGGFSNVTL